MLTHWGQVMHICVNKILIIGSDNGLSPDWRQAIIWTNAGILLNGPLGTNFSEIPIEFHTYSFKKIHLKMSSRKYRPFCLSLNVLKFDFYIFFCLVGIIFSAHSRFVCYNYSSRLFHWDCSGSSEVWRIWVNWVGGYYAKILLPIVFPIFYSLSEHMLGTEYHIHIWQVSVQLSCTDTCQIWWWFKECNRYVCKL